MARAVERDTLFQDSIYLQTEHMCETRTKQFTQIQLSQLTIEHSLFVQKA